MCGPGVDVRPMPIDDSWMRDSGPIIVRAPDGARHAVHFRFNAWGEKYEPYDRDAQIGARIAHALGFPVHEAPLVLEGGSFAVDGAGTLVTTERCLLNANRNPHLSKVEIERALRQWLGVERIVWLRDGIAEDDGTDGHVDNVVAFSAPAARVAPGLRRSAEPEPRDRRGQRRATAGRRDRRHRDPDAAVRGRVGRNRAGSVREPLRGERGRGRADHGRGRGRRRARVIAPSIRAARSSPSRVRSSRTVAVACTASPSRSRHDPPHRVRRPRVAGACRRAAPDAGAGGTRAARLAPGPRGARTARYATACCSRPAPERSSCACRS